MTENDLSTPKPATRSVHCSRNARRNAARISKRITLGTENGASNLLLETVARGTLRLEAVPCWTAAMRQAIDLRLPWLIAAIPGCFDPWKDVPSTTVADTDASSSSGGNGVEDGSSTSESSSDETLYAQRSRFLRGGVGNVGGGIAAVRGRVMLENSFVTIRFHSSAVVLSNANLQMLYSTIG